MIIAIANSKGGVGKSTLAVHLAAWLDEQGHRVLLADCDTQHSSSEWIRQAMPAKSRPSASTPPMRSSTIFRVFRPKTRLHRRRWSRKPDRDEPGLLLRADFAIVPCKASMLEVRALAKATEVLRQAQDIRNGLPQAVAVLSMVGQNYRLTKDMKEAADAPRTATGLASHDAPPDLRRCPGQAQVVWNMGAKARDAAEEVDALFTRAAAERRTQAKRQRRFPSRRAKNAEQTSREGRRGESRAKRMSLVEGLKRDQEKLDPAVVESFVKHGTAAAVEPPVAEAKTPRAAPPRSAPESTQEPAENGKTAAVMTPGLIPVNVRVRPDIARALQTATLDRQLRGIEPHTKREIVEQALEAWLRKNGYL